MLKENVNTQQAKYKTKKNIINSLQKENKKKKYLKFQAK